MTDDIARELAACREAFGPHYEGPCWHLHHDELLEWTHDASERIEYIRTEKPEPELAPRLRLLRPVRGELPQAIVKAIQTAAKARRAYDKRPSYFMALGLMNALDALCGTVGWHRAEIDALHRAECPDCPWDGKTIFPGG